MNKSWIYIYLAGLIEILWVTGLKYADHLWEWATTAGLLVLSFYLVIKAVKNIPAGTAYAVFVGMGTAGTTLTGILFFGESFQWMKLILITTLLSGVLGLKLISVNREKKGADS
ncbi:MULTISPECIES: DMT family transporter [Bacillus]|uniref:Multidrug resistance protein SMR n=2 Tax=Bacillus TaxID=1386 RepID=A0A0M4G8W0_9BACI|nr:MULTISPECIES: multidrug efflux SMR transporter [Bacillus]ALC81703.1 multidrug resistance protein SMR [Bacillus gobiensis]MBP1080757.1 paired small multidrug resistance pump [Bacillus capparidis]MED1094612.1 multidrug efflux SMR transporter [Bacillus capparidis]